MSEKKNVISFMNMKGGVGKTTLCVNLAYSLAKLKGKKVLVIDLDPQSNSSQYMLKKDQFKELIENKKTLYSIYQAFLEPYSFSIVDGNSTEDEEVRVADIIYRVSENLDLIPGDIRLVKMSQGIDPSVVNALGNFLSANKIYDTYEYIFIDCPPTQSIYTSSAMNISNYYMLPVKPDFLSSIGIDIMKNIVKNHNKTTSKKIECLGIIFNMVHKSEYEKEKMEEIKSNHFMNIFRSYISNNSNVAKAPENQEYILNIKGNKIAMQKITEEFIKRIDK